MRLPSNIVWALSIPTILTAAFASAATSPNIPDNIGGGLRQLIEAERNVPASRSAATSLAPLLLRDQQDRVLVNVWLDGKRPLAAVHQALAGLGVNVHAELATYRKGVIAAYVPIERAVAVAGLAGVRSVILERKPELRRGKATTQGLKTIHADKLNKLGLLGDGVTIAALSDSFNANKTATNGQNKPDHEAQDIKSGDLPGPGNPFGDTTPVLVLDEDPDTASASDEGRGILQIIYDIAPKSKLCFATAFTGEVQFAINILKLADKKGPCKANVIDDDVGYSQEPFFSDGVVALAIDQVAADGVVYFSSAGNNNSGNYLGTFNPISDADARSTDSGPLSLGNVDTALTGGGFHNFGTAKNVQIALPISVAAQSGTHFLVLQWDDEFFGNTPTASYDFLVFDANGFYHPELSGIDNVYSTGQPVQGITLPSSNTVALTYYIAVALRPGFTQPYAHQLGIQDFDDGNQVTLLDFANPFAPSAYGHPAAAGAIAVAADFWGNTQSTEFYSSLGPIPIWLNGDGVRLAKPEIRQKPEIAAPDGVDTTAFFGNPGLAGDPNPQFYCTSAAAPHAAAATALLIEAAGGPGKLTPAGAKTLLETTTQQPHQLDAGIVGARLSSGPDTLSVAVMGFNTGNPNQFRFTFKGAAGDSVSRIVLDAAPAHLVFGDNTLLYEVGHTSFPAKDITYLNKNVLSAKATLAFKPGAFQAGDHADVGIYFDNTLLDQDGLGFFGFGMNAGLLYGTTVTATLEIGGKPMTVHGVLSGPTGDHYSVADGYGLIDAYAAYKKLKAAPGASAGR